MRQEDEAGGPQDTGKAQEPEGSAEKAGSKKDKYQKAQAKAEHTGEKLVATRNTSAAARMAVRIQSAMIMKRLVLILSSFSCNNCRFSSYFCCRVVSF